MNESWDWIVVRWFRARFDTMERPVDSADASGPRREDSVPVAIGFRRRTADGF